MDKNNFYIMLEKKWFYNKEKEIVLDTFLQKYEKYGLMIYCILLRTLTSRNTFTLNLNDLYATLQIDKSKQWIITSKIRSIIVEKMNNNLFTICTDSNCNIPLIIDIDIKDDKTKYKNFNNDITYYCIRKEKPLENKYIMIYDHEIDTLAKHIHGKKKSLEDIITHYCYIVNDFTGKKKNENESVENESKEADPEGYLCSYPKLDTICEKTNIGSKSTLIDNNKIFIESGLLIIGNPGGRLEDEIYTNSSNVYARAKDTEQFNKFMEIRKKSLNKKYENVNDKKLQDSQRAIKQKINNYKKSQGFDNKTTINDLTNEQIAILHELELAHYNLTISRDKKQKQPHYLTLKLDGTLKLKCVSEGEAPKTDVDPQDVFTKLDGQTVIVEESNCNKNPFEQPSTYNKEKKSRWLKNCSKFNELEEVYNG